MRFSFNNNGARMYFSTIATSLFIQGCTVFQGIIIARLLGPEGRGQFAAIVLWPNVFAMIGLTGAYMALARRAGKNEDTSPLVKSAVIIACLTGLITTISCSFFLPHLMPKKIAKLLSFASLFLFYIPLNHITYNLLSIDQGRGNYNQYNLSRAILYPVFFAGLIVTHFFIFDKLKGVVVSLLICNGIVVVLQLILKWNDLWRRANHISIRIIFREGWSFHLSTLFTLLNQYIDQIFILWLLDSIDLGLYMIALSSSSVIASLPTALGIISFSEAVKMDKLNGFFPFAVMMRRSALVLLILGCLYAPALPFLLPLVYGADFIAAVPIARILLAGVILSGLSTIVEQTLFGHGKAIPGITARLMGTIAFVGIGILYIGKYGALGVAVSYVISQAVVFVFFLKISVNYFEGARMKDFIPRMKDPFNLR